MSKFNFGVNKASDRKNLREMLTSLTLVGLVAAVVGTGEKNEEVNSAIEKLGFVGFSESLTDVLRTQVSGSRGRPALEEQPIHAIIMGLRNASASFSANENMEKALKVLGKSLKEAEKAQARLIARRAIFKPSKRIQGTKLLPVLATGEE
jgi:hypothetical protein